MDAKKVLGQNFLIDKNKIEAIVNAIPELETSTILEVGPGRGAITKPLVDRANKVIAIEIDEDMVYVLENTIPKKGFTLLHRDILDVEWDEVLGDETNIQFVSNLPYYISTKIMFKVAYDKRFDSMSIMLQKELVDRIFAKNNTKAFGRITVAIGSLFNLEKKINVPAGCFHPKPNVDSGFIVLSRKEFPFEVDDYLIFVKAAFAMKRKTIMNSLKKSGYENWELAFKFLETNEIKLNIRSEEMPIEMFMDMYKFIKENQD